MSNVQRNETHRPGYDGNASQTGFERNPDIYGYGHIENYTMPYDDQNDLQARMRAKERRKADAPTMTGKDGRIYDEICEAMSCTPGFEAAALAVRVVDGIVTLTGTVANDTDRFRAESLVWSIDGVKQVVNNVQRTSYAGEYTDSIPLH